MRPARPTPRGVAVPRHAPRPLLVGKRFVAERRNAMRRPRPTQRGCGRPCGVMRRATDQGSGVPPRRPRPDTRPFRSPRHVSAPEGHRTASRPWEPHRAQRNLRIPDPRPAWCKATGQRAWHTAQARYTPARAGFGNLAAAILELGRCARTGGARRVAASTARGPHAAGRSENGPG